MDTFTFLVALMLIMLAMQYNQTWMILGVVAILILAIRSWTTIILLVLTLVILYFLRGADMVDYWPIVVFGMVIVALVLGIKAEPKEPEMYGGDMMGGLEGYGGLGGLG